MPGAGLYDADDEFQFADAHVHFWDHSVSGLHWPYLDPGFSHPRLRDMHRLDAPAFTDQQLAEQAGAYTPQRIVHVQSSTEHRPGQETSWLQAIADERQAVHAIVARARLVEPDLDDVLRANCARLVRGVRDMSSPTHIGSEEFTRGFDRIAAMDLGLEVLVPYPQFAHVRTLADRHPHATIVLGHAGQPEQRDQAYFDAWSRTIERFRDCDNVVVKVSALASGADPQWSIDSIRPWAERCIEAFGPNRAMFGSNWPIDGLYGTYPKLIEAYREIAAQYSAAEQRMLFVGTATRTYGLAPLRPASFATDSDQSDEVG